MDEQRTVLIIEDEPALQELYTKIISDAGIAMLTASTGQKGVELALRHHPDVTLMDITLPDISGHDAVKKIRLDPWGRHATIIFLTNRTDAENIAEAVAEGGEEYIIKAHTSNHELLNRVRSAMLA